MFLRRCRPSKGAGKHVYWQLVESYRTERGPRQRVVAYLGDVSERKRLGMLVAAKGASIASGWQSRLFDEEGEPEWVEVDAKRVRVEGVRDFGGSWLGLEISERLELIPFLERWLPAGREDIPWSMMAMTLVLMRLCEPSSELRIAEHLYERSILTELLGIPADKVNDDRLYRALDRLLPHRSSWRSILKDGWGHCSTWNTICCSTM